MMLSHECQRAHTVAGVSMEVSVYFHSEASGATPKLHFIGFGSTLGNVTYINLLQMHTHRYNLAYVRCLSAAITQSSYPVDVRVDCQLF